MFIGIEFFCYLMGMVFVFLYVVFILFCLLLKVCFSVLIVSRFGLVFVVFILSIWLNMCFENVCRDKKVFMDYIYCLLYVLEGEVVESLEDEIDK